MYNYGTCYEYYNRIDKEMGVNRMPALKMKVSGSQMFWMIASMEVGMTLLLTVNPALAAAKQNAWISCLLAGGIGVFIALLGAKLSVLYPNKTLVEYSQTILGKWFGKMIVVPYFVMWFSAIAIILRQSGELIVEFILPGTPLFVVILTMAFVVLYAASSGLEVIGRVSEIIGPIIMILIVLSLLLSLNHMKWVNLLPTYFDSGWLSVIKGALPTASFLGESIMITMLLPFASKPKEGATKAILGVGIASLMISLSYIFIIAVLGTSVATTKWYPFFELLRYISIDHYLENWDGLVIMIWLGSIFIKLSLYFFITSYGIAQWIGMQKRRTLFWVQVPIVVGLAVLPRNIVEASILFPSKFWVPFVLPINMIGIPLFLWIIGAAKKKKIWGNCRNETR
jgi:spore germination protein KB